MYTCIHIVILYMYMYMYGNTSLSPSLPPSLPYLRISDVVQEEGKQLLITSALLLFPLHCHLKFKGELTHV